MKRGLRLRIGATFALFALAVVIIQTTYVVLVTDAQEEEFIEQILTEEMARLRDAYRAFGSPALPRGHLLEGYALGPVGDRTVLPAHLRELDVGNHEIVRDGKEYHVHVREDGDARLYLVYDATRHEERMGKFALHLLAAVLSAGVVSAVAAYWLSGVLVRQVSDLATRVARLDPVAAAPHLADGQLDEEVSTLASAFDRYHERVAAVVEREKQFTSNVSHELRTPLTTIKTSCELLVQDPALTGKSQERLAGIARAADRMTELTEALLLLARQTTLDGAQELVPLQEAAEEVVASLRESLSRRHIDVELRVPAHAAVRTPRLALHVVLSNLLRNAASYTDRGRITVGYRDGTLSVADTGRGIAATDLPRIFDRFYRGEARRAHAEGSGLGLAIVKHIADRLGWKLGVASELGKGSTFTVEFPPSSRFHHA